MDDVVAAVTAMLLVAVDGELERFKKCVEAVDRLIGDGIAAIIENTKDDYGKGVIHFAAGGGNVEVLKYLIKEIKLDVNVKDNSGVTPLSWAAIEGHYAAVEYLLEMGANPEMPDNSNCTPLHHSAMKGHKDVIPLLLSKGINVDVTNELGSPLQFAATHGLHDTVKVLLDHGANVSSIYLLFINRCGFLYSKYSSDI
ncbi:hypothetical protein MKW98_015062 [Papaver atlanticum]|uniref:Uncharacterized protein n=1 Tax=Papaver atlanticum TaxID=357466 RepID=A0AAD4XAJ0_9MAGN|nr:hypothetical protein MKW98_015062 [Papaver atlanticum]